MNSDDLLIEVSDPELDRFWASRAKKERFPCPNEDGYAEEEGGLCWECLAKLKMELAGMW